MTGKTRRDVLIGGGATAAAIATAALTRGTLARTTDFIAASEWDYRTITELVAALQAKKISALELANHLIARIETVDRRVNAVVVRDQGAGVRLTRFSD
jgi:amidase